MRVISGKQKGAKLFTLEGLDTRPTLDRVKESLFNIINFDIRNSIFLDLFAGSGSIGIEAASREAKKVYMCEKSKSAVNIINRNIEKTKMQQQIELFNMDFKKCIEERLTEKLDIIYIDPPYKTDYAYISTKMLLEKDLIKNETLIIIETDIEEKVENQLEELKLTLVNKKKYGRVCLLFYKIDDTKTN